MLRDMQNDENRRSSITVSSLIRFRSNRQCRERSPSSPRRVAQLIMEAAALHDRAALKAEERAVSVACAVGLLRLHEVRCPYVFSRNSV